MRETKKSKVGVAGVDVGFFFTRQLGVGAMVQFAGTTLDIPSAGGGTQEVKTAGCRPAADCVFASGDSRPQRSGNRSLSFHTLISAYSI